MMSVSASRSPTLVPSREAASAMASFMPTERSYVVDRVLHHTRSSPWVT